MPRRTRPVGDRASGRLGPAGTADQHQRPFGALDQPPDPQARRGRRLACPLDTGPVERLDLIEQHVLRQRQHHRARPSVHRGGIGARDIFRDTRGIVDPRRPFAQRREHRLEVDLLKGFAVAGAAIDIADEQDHRLRVLHRDMHADRGIGRARAARDEGDAGPPRQRAVGTGHERRTALCRQTTRSIAGVSCSASSTARKLSPGTVKIRSHPCARSWSTRRRPPVLLVMPGHSVGGWERIAARNRHGTGAFAPRPAQIYGERSWR